MSIAMRESRPVKSFGVRLHNRRVVGGMMADGSILWQFKRLTPERLVECKKIRLSKQAVAAMFSIMAKIDTPDKQPASRAGEEKR